MTIAATDVGARLGAAAKIADASSPIGLTSAEADRRRRTFGPNAIADTSGHAFGRALEKFWSPVPWMLEGAIALELAMGKFVEAVVIGILLVFNAALSYFQEGRAQATLAALKSRLAITASVRRDGIWKLVPTTELVPGDTVKLSLGALVPADANIQPRISSSPARRTGERPFFALWLHQAGASRGGARNWRPLRNAWKARERIARHVCGLVNCSAFFVRPRRNPATAASARAAGLALA